MDRQSVHQATRCTTTVNASIRRSISRLVSCVGSLFSSAPGHELTVAPDATQGIDGTIDAVALKELAGYFWAPTQAQRGAKYEITVQGYFPVCEVDGPQPARAEVKPLKNIFVEKSVLNERDNGENGHDRSWKHVTMLQIKGAVGHLFLAFSQHPPHLHGTRTEGEIISDSTILSADPSMRSRHVREKHLKLYQRGSDIFDENDDTILIELLAQPQIVPFRNHAHENAPFKVKDTAPLFGGTSRKGVLALRTLLHFLLRSEDIHDHHVWNELAHGHLKSYNECIHFGLRVWREFVDHEDAEDARATASRGLIPHETDTNESDVTSNCDSTIRPLSARDRWISQFDYFFQKDRSPKRAIGRWLSEFFHSGGRSGRQTSPHMIGGTPRRLDNEGGRLRRAFTC